MSAISSPPAPTTSTPSTGLEKVLALHTFTAENDDELSFGAGEYVWILEKDEVYGDGWWKGRNKLNAEGLFPASYILPDGVDPAPYLAMQSGNGGLGAEETMPSPPSPSGGNGKEMVGQSGRFDALGPDGNGTGNENEAQTTAKKAEALGPAELAAAHVEHSPPQASMTGQAKPRTLSPSPSRSPPARRTSAIDDMKTQVQAALDETTGTANARSGGNSSVTSPAIGMAQENTPVNLDVSNFPQPPTPKSTLGLGLAKSSPNPNNETGSFVHDATTLPRSGQARDISDVMPPMPGTASTTSFGTEEGDESIVSHEEGDRAAEAGGVRTRLAESARLENLKSEQKVAHEAEEKRKREEGLGLGLLSASGNNTPSMGSTSGNGGFGGFKVPNGLFGNSGGQNGNNKTGVRMSAGAGMASGLVYSDESDATDSDEEDQRELDKRLSGNDSTTRLGGALINAASMGSPRNKGGNALGGRLGDDDGFGWSGAAANAFGVKTPLTNTARQFSPSQSKAASPSLRSSQAFTPPVSVELASPPRQPFLDAPREAASPSQGLGGALPPFPSSFIAGQSETPSSAPTPKPPAVKSEESTDSAGGFLGAATPQPREENRTPLASPPNILAPIAVRTPQQLQPSFMAMDESPGGTAYIGPTESNGFGSSVPEYDPMAAKGAELGTERDLARVENAQPRSMGPPPAPVAALQRQASSDLVPPRPASGGAGAGRSWADVPGDPRLWSVQQVTEWAQSRGFDQGICDKFVENEIDGEVLLSLDVNLLKELDIPQFGKRIKIANAINELRRPASNLSAGHASEARSSRQISPAYNNGGQGTPYNRPPSTASAQSPMGGSGYPASPTYGTYAESQPSHSRSASGAGAAFASAAEGAGLGYEQPRRPSDTAGPASGYSEWAHGKVQSRKASAHDSFKGINAPIREEDENGKAAYIAPSSQAATPEPQATDSMPSFAVPITTPHTATTTSSSIRSRNSSIPPSPSTPNTKHSSLDRGASFALGHKKEKSLGERTSFFGTRTRKPAPRFPSSASNVAVDRASDVGQSPNGKSGIRNIMGRNSGQRVSGAPSLSTSMVSAPTSPARAQARKDTPPNAVASAVSKIGKPDYSGYMKKKGENYRSWKMRYFVLKGAHLYYMRNESEEKIKGHIDLQGYKVLADGNTGPGTYGFQLVHDRSQPHSFSSNEQRVVKEWMKQLMKATITRDYSAPVVSSCNIPTIPLKEAQALQPRPPSPGARDATQRATRRENPNQLTARDASVLMSLDNTPASPKAASTNRNSTPAGGREPKSPSLNRRSGDRYVRNASIGSVAGLGAGGGAYTSGSNTALLPPRPSRELRMASNASSVYPEDTGSGGVTPRANSQAAFGGAGLAAPMTYTSPPADSQGSVFGSGSPSADDRELLAWVNSHLPKHETARATTIPGSFVSGQFITRVIEHFVAPPFPPPSNPSSSIPANAEQFEPIGGEANLEGLFTMMDKAIDEGMDTGGVSINDVRMGRDGEIRRLLVSLRSWGEAKKAEAAY